MTGGYYSGNRKYGIYCEDSGALRMHAIAAQDNQVDGADDAFHPQVRLKNCHGFSIVGAHIEEFDNNINAKTGLTCEFCLGGFIGSSYFGNTTTGVVGSRGILIVSGSRGIVVGPNMFNLVDKLVEIYAPDGTNTDCIVMPQMPQNLDANTSGSILMPDSDGNGNFAFVPTTKTSKVGAGLLLPRVTTTVRNAIPAGVLQRGIVIYNSTTGKLNFYDGTAWRAVTST